jgi:hypothetical protein
MSDTIQDKTRKIIISTNEITMYEGGIMRLGDVEIHGLNDTQLAALHRTIGARLDAISREKSQLGPAWKDLWGS